ncbi:protein YIPF3 isoform X1 [Cimex lectularius]|uniref:Protein YIPF3 n=1 Tax=Cimex lectularius TaxID=79782 RepID=A0A8I6TKJ9_CIMLE|nr:protein YIPF3 isoform X1 [Cimex lectularius]XP_024083666.1 protein YIPF3 isoform X1 [Cimex lectularius]XP_024083667.1 protein YIPF3 isoform X1 [Cimex lectularius]
MKNYSVVFIENSDYQRFDKDKNFNLKNVVSTYFTQFKELPKRIYISFIPPVFSENSKKVYVDLVGPLLALLILGFLLNLGHSYKHPLALADTPPFLSLVLYATFLPSFCFILVKLGKSNLNPMEIISILGYGLYAHIFTIMTCYLVDSESSNYLFFLSMIFFGGLSGFRIVVILLLTIPKPGARLVACSLVTIFHLLFLIFIHFVYMHKTFKYGTGIKEHG